MKLMCKYLLVQVTHFALKLYGADRSAALVPRIITTGSALIVLGLFFCCQVLKLYEEVIDIKLIIDVLPAAVTSLMCSLSMMVAELNGKRDWNSARSEDETAIKHNYILQTKLFVLYYTMSLLVAIVIGVTWAFGAEILDVLVPLNESRPRELIFRGEYFLDETKYYYPILLFQLMLTFCVLIIVTIVQSLFAVLVHQACSMFAIVGYRIEHVTTIGEKEWAKDQLDRESLMAEKIVSCVRGHLSALQFSASVHSMTTHYLFLSLVTTALGLTFLLAAMSVPEFRNAKTMLFAGGLCGQFFFLSYLGQKLMDTSVHLPNRICNARWYDCPPRLRRLFVLVIMRAHKPSSIVMSALFVLSLENFCTVANSAMSYCMVLRQFQ